jgi:hypothetical protein
MIAELIVWLLLGGSWTVLHLLFAAWWLWEEGGGNSEIFQRQRTILDSLSGLHYRGGTHYLRYFALHGYWLVVDG